MITNLSYIKESVTAAESRIRPYIKQTSIESSSILSDLCQSSIYLKLENRQITGSFKVRGALNKILNLTQQEKQQGIITASTGNHGLGVAYALHKTNCTGTIYLPKNTPQYKIDAFKPYTVPLQFYGDDCEITEAYARDLAEKTGKTYISPYNDPEIIAGQGTIGYELETRLKDVDVVFVSVGGGGLISGIAGYLKAVCPDIIIVGCLPENSPVMYESVKAGKIINIQCQPTLSDSTAGGIEEGSLTFEFCKNLVDHYILVSEDEIKRAILLILEHHKFLVEGAAGVSVAAALKHKETLHNKNAAIVLCGSNIGLNTLKKLLQ